MSAEVLPWPEDWRAVPLWAMFDRVKDVGHPEEELLSVYRDHGVVRKQDRSDNFNKTALNRDIYQLVDRGWLVVNRMKAWQGSLGISPYRGIVSGHYLCFRPTHVEDHRFLHYLLRSAPYTAQLGKQSRGVRPNQIEIDNDALRVLNVWLPPREQQRRTVSFLDAETARIDALIAAKMRMADLTRLRIQAWFDSTLADGSLRCTAAQVRHVTQAIIDTEHSTAPADPAGNHLLVRTSNIRSGRLVQDGIVRIGDETYEHWTRRGRPIAGDVLFTREAPAGEACVVPADVSVCIGQRVVLLKPNCRVRPEWLMRCLYAEQARQYMALVSRETTVARVNMAEVPGIPIPLPDLAAQDEVLGQIHWIERRAADLAVTLTTQIGLLKERRQALITAAVTGEIEV